MRWTVLATVLFFGMGVGVAPVPHFAEDGGEISDYLAAVAEFEAHAVGVGHSVLPGEPLPPNHPVPDDVDCLFCLLLVAPATVGELAPAPLWDASTTTPESGEFTRAGSFDACRANQARAPPHA